MSSPASRTKGPLTPLTKVRLVRRLIPCASLAESMRLLVRVLVGRESSQETVVSAENRHRHVVSETNRLITSCETALRRG